MDSKPINEQPMASQKITTRALTSRLYCSTNKYPKKHSTAKHIVTVENHLTELLMRSLYTTMKT